MESARTHKAGTHKYPPRRQSGYTSDPHTTSSIPAMTGSANTPLFISINSTHMHRQVTLLPYVDLNNTYRPSFLFDAFFVINGTHTSCYAPLCQGLHSTHNMAIKSGHLFGRSAPRTYSTICISFESCLGSLVGFARLPCFGTLRSAPSAKVALGEQLRLCPGSSGRTPQ